MVVKLKGKANYQEWARDVRATLTAQNLWGVVSGTEQCPTPPATFFGFGNAELQRIYVEELYNWKENINKANGILRDTTTSNVRDSLKNDEDPVTRWISLRDLFGPTCTDLCRQLKRLHQQPPKSIEEHEKKYEAIIDTLSELGITFDEQHKSVNYLSTLPDTYSSFVQSLELDILTLEFQAVKTKVRDEVRTRKGAKVAFATPPAKNDPAQGLVSTGRFLLRRATTSVLQRNKGSRSTSDSPSSSNGRSALGARFADHFPSWTKRGAKGPNAARTLEDGAIKRQDTATPKGDGPTAKHTAVVDENKNSTKVDESKTSTKVEHGPATPENPIPLTVDKVQGKYVGQINDGCLPNGHGEWTSIDRTKSYKGSWVNGCKEGKGVHIEPDYEYDGPWLGGRKHGQHATERVKKSYGKWVVYEIGFHRGERHGTGTKDGATVRYEYGNRRDKLFGFGN